MGGLILLVNMGPGKFTCYKASGLFTVVDPLSRRSLGGREEEDLLDARGLWEDVLCTLARRPRRLHLRFPMHVVLQICVRSRYLLLCRRTRDIRYAVEMFVFLYIIVPGFLHFRAGRLYGAPYAWTGQ